MLPLVASADPVIIDGIRYNLTAETKQAEVTASPSEYTGIVVIPEKVTYESNEYSVTHIGYKAFYNCSGLTSVTIPNSVTGIGRQAFYNCSGLTSITIPNNVTGIGNHAFCLCSGLTSITIPNSVTSIGEGAFKGCFGLTSVTISNSVTSIGESVFDACRSLTSITIPNSVTSIGLQAFDGCYGLTSVTIPNSVTSIGIYSFRNCYGLTTVTIPNSVTSIGYRAFDGCSGLTFVTIGSGVTSIGEGVFNGTNIPAIVSLIENPFAIAGKATSDRTFSQNTFNNATLYVPTGTIEKYKATEGWKDFLNIVEGNPTGIKVIDNTQNKNATIYDMNGVRLSEPKKGINIINGKKIIVK